MNKRIRIRIISIALASITALCFPLLAVADEEAHGEGYVKGIELMDNGDGGVSAQKLSSATTYPTKLDPRSETWYQNIKIKNQQSTGLCWAFATTTASEISYTKESGNTVDYVSPGHLGYFSYNRSSTAADPLGNTVGDAVSGGTSWFNTGGNSAMSMIALANGNGLCKESLAPYSWVGNPTVSNSTYNYSLAYNDYLVLEDAYYYCSSGMSADKIKEYITKYGAVFCSIGSPNNTSYIKSNGNEVYSMNCPEGAVASHAVTMIGWDDNYSKDNFKTKPSGNGAWLIQNSWGTSTTYIWVSYYDSLVTEEITAFDLRLAESDDVQFQHDGTCSFGYYYFYSGEKAANIYTAPSGKSYTLDQVGFANWNTNSSSYTITVYKNLTNKSTPEPSGKTAAASFNVTAPGGGYFTYDLPQSLDIAGGEIFSIVVEAKSTTYLAADKSYNISGEVTFSPSISAGQSFVYESGSWSDLSTRSTPFTMRIKGLGKVKDTSHTHSLTPVSKKAATQTADGNIAYYYCSGCGKYYSDSAGNTEITQASTVIKKIASIELSQSSYDYDGTAKTPTVTVKDSAGTTLSSTNDYSVEYSNNINPSTNASVKITFKGNYSGTATKTFTITSNIKLTGTVTGYTGSGLKLELVSTGGDTQTSSSTSYSFGSLLVGNYTLKVSADGDYVARDYSISISKSATQNVEIRQLGDVNCDGVRSAADITAIAKHVAKTSTITDAYKLKLCDTNKSSSVSIEDATKLAKYLAKIVSSL